MTRKLVAWRSAMLFRTGATRHKFAHGRRLVGCGIALAIAVPGGTEPAEAAYQGRLAFVSERDGNPNVYVMNADGSGQTQLTTDPAPDLNPTWSPDGSTIAFESTRDGRSEIFVMNSNGSGQTPLTSSAEGSWNPVWSPDGSKIAFEGDVDGVTQVFSMNGDGSGQTQLTTGPEDDSHPSWSPDGSRIAFASYYDPQPHPDDIYLQVNVYVMNADGSGPIEIGIDTYGSEPLWSPDGSKIAYGACGAPCGDHWIRVVNVDGSGSWSTDQGVKSEYFPDWSPDGSRIAFGQDDSAGSRVLAMNADGSGEPTQLAAGSIAHSPVWSPDGSRIAFSINASTIALVNADGSDTTELTNDGYDPAWQPLPSDTDADGLLDADEVAYSSDPLNPDTDGDGIPDGRDIEHLHNAIDGLPASAFRTAQRRTSMHAILNDVEALVADGYPTEAVAKLGDLRRRMDGCGLIADRNDWIDDCTAQVEIRRLIDQLIANLTV